MNAVRGCFSRGEETLAAVACSWSSPTPELPEDCAAPSSLDGKTEADGAPRIGAYAFSVDGDEEEDRELTLGLELALAEASDVKLNARLASILPVGTTHLRACCSSTACAKVGM